MIQGYTHPVVRNMKSRTLQLLIFILISAGLGSSIGSSANNVNFFSCISAGGLRNFTTPYADQEYIHIFNLAAHNLRVISAFSKPNAIVLPETKEQLAATIVCCRKASLRFTFRSGGHNLEGISYSSMSHPYVMIDLLRLNKVAVDLATKAAWVEGGATLGEVYYAVGTSSNSLGFTAGFCPAVGSGGHIGGGGFGFMSRKYGLASDNVVDAILIDANGKFLDRKSMGEDVFWAIRGGGAGSWGAVYSWKITLVDVPETVTVLQLTRNGSSRDAAKLLNKWQWVAPDLEDEFTLMVSVTANSGTSVVTNYKGLYLGPQSSAIASINRVYPELEVVEGECKEMKWVESNVYLADFTKSFTVDALKDRFAASDQKIYFKWKGDYVKKRISVEGIEGMLELLIEEPHGEFQLVPFGGMMARTSSDATPYPHREGNLYSIGYLATWNEHENVRSNAYLNWIHRVYKYMTPHVSMGPRTAYVNEMDLDFGEMDWGNLTISADEQVELGRVWGEKYFLRNYDRLVRAKTAVDPHNVFRHQQSIPPRQDQGLCTDEVRFH
ncbi:hypothetical protein Scep_019692 [Stephania cephalantha]|uniref:FAD-binding PCMH-type domain-containing protein n=1 Tax=Stephania cephalantha TaxID=152367 RepID=A0AAP0IBN5_9MAGN